MRERVALEVVAILPFEQAVAARARARGPRTAGLLFESEPKIEAGGGAEVIQCGLVVGRLRHGQAVAALAAACQCGRRVRQRCAGVLMLRVGITSEEHKKLKRSSVTL